MKRIILTALFGLIMSLSCGQLFAADPPPSPKPDVPTVGGGTGNTGAVEPDDGDVSPPPPPVER